MLFEQGGADQRNVSEKWDFKRRSGGELFLNIANAHKGRESNAKQTQGQSCRVLIGAEVNDQNTKYCSQHGARCHASQKAQGVTACVHHSRKACNGCTQHHALGTQVNDAGLFIDEQTHGRNGQHGACIKGGSNQ